MTSLLRVRRLYVNVGERTILRGVDLDVGRGEVHVLMGPNAAGKTALLKTIMGDPRYKVLEGTIVFNDVNITGLKPYERAKLGLALAYQHPPRVKVRFNYLLERMARKFGIDGMDLDDKLGVRHLLDRNLFEGFSGGEAKRAELLLTILQRPRLALLDEPDSGVDVDSMAVIASAINMLVDEGSSVLLVTHTGHILRRLKRIDALHVMINGRIVYSGDPSVVDEILKFGYERFSR